MEREKLESLIIDYIDDNLSPEERRLVEEELGRSADAQKLYAELQAVMSAMAEAPPLQPASRLEKRFRATLKEQNTHQSGSRTIFFKPWLYRAAAAVALVAVAGFLINRYNEQSQQLADMRLEVEETRRQLAETKEVMMDMLGNELSASQRMKGVQVALRVRKADDEIVKALSNTMLTDPSTNVRLAALEALAKFSDDPQVKSSLIGSLSAQTDPMVQIALIRLLVEMKEKSVVDDLQKMVKDEALMQAVKDEAYSGILKLS